MKNRIVVVAHDMRSCHNVGSLLRTAEGLGVDHVYLTGYTPHPVIQDDERLPHLSAKITRQIDKTALGAAESQPWSYVADVNALIESLRQESYFIAALEQSDNSIPLPSFSPPAKTALLLGKEVEGIDPSLLTKADICLEIPMFGKKESFNVVQAAAMALYHCRLFPANTVQ